MLHVGVAQIGREYIGLNNGQARLIQDILNRIRTAIDGIVYAVKGGIETGKDLQIENADIIENAVGCANDKALGFERTPGHSNARGKVVKVLSKSCPRDPVCPRPDKLAIRIG